MEKAMKKVLIIAYGFPPIGGVGIIRTLKFTKYLPEHGWIPYVLTVKNRDRFYTDCGGDEIPAHVQVYRAWNIFNNLSVVEGGLRKIGVHSKFLIPDAYIGWIPLAVKKGKEIIKQEDIDLIYVSCPPQSSSLIAARLKEITGVPFVLDLRDAWTLNPYEGMYSLHSLKKMNEILEKYVFLSADFIVTASDGVKSDYSLKYPFVEPKISTIRNGFDPDDIPVSIQPFEKFTITYTGYFYGVQTPELLFAALNIILHNNLISKEEIQFLWAGRDAPFVHDLAIKYNVASIVNYVGLVSKKEADEYLYRSNLLFHVIGSTDTVSQKKNLSAKMYPYLASGRPILNLVPPDSAAKELFEEYSDKCYNIAFQDVDAMVKAIMDTYSRWKGNKTDVQIDLKTKQFRERYNIPTLTEQLTEIFSSCLQKSKLR